MPHMAGSNQAPAGAAIQGASVKIYAADEVRTIMERLSAGALAERKMQGFKSGSSAQRFLTTHASVYNTFYTQRHLTPRRTLREFRAAAFEDWSGANCA